ncbi:similar to Saccharomyces cerevisiae YOR154W SLP1 Integral membrane protein of unknown function [Maudiozyma saulgeensis]|uniref:SUN-like protein 1 n=1 Tax=Maudiozyma saulgeensis TaxID=1789683 RepID=A0A1X7R394_9SACH|nr:similar to Saccharomyces cerevisiae YOR154W SLP1 Integral membrane protein of unknown function [Kazachstania saulgeensis]
MVYINILYGFIIYCLIFICRGEEESNGSFVSFEEWKQSKKDGSDKMLDINDGSRRIREVADPSCYRGGDSYGEEMEIELGFLGSEEIEPEGRVYKDKYNYASLDCAATIVKTNSQASGATSILVENKDKYLLNPCSAESQYVIIELCEDILVEEIELGNFEYFSSTFKGVKFYVSDRLPVTKSGWTLIGEFQAENSRQLQIFSIENPRRWARYLRVEIVSHYGNEFYCPISMLKVHGQTMMDEFKLGETEPQCEGSPNEVKKETAKDKEGIVKETTPKNGTIDGDCSVKVQDVEKEEVIVKRKKDTCREEDMCLENKMKQWFERSMKIFEVMSSTNKNGTADICLNNTQSSLNTGQIRKPTEESIFKNMIKRLNTLESNSTLTVQYIEEQNRLLTHSLNNSIVEVLELVRSELALVQRTNDLHIEAIRREQRFLIALIVVLICIVSLYIFNKRTNIII